MPATPLESMRDRLVGELAARRPGFARKYNYYRGDHPLPGAPQEVREAYAAFLKMARSNWCRLVVKATSERLRVVGMRFSTSEGSGDTGAWTRYWQANNLDLASRQVHDAALITGRGFALVWPTGDIPSITPEHPLEVIVAYDPGSRRRVAGLKTFTDPVAKRRYATLWTPDEVNQWTAKVEGSTLSPQSRWEPWDDPDRGIVSLAANPLGEVPLVEFVADPDLLDEPMGELDGGVTDIQDRINRTILDRLVTSNFASFQQKWATGLEIPRDDNGNDIEPFKVAVNRLFVSENPETRFGQFAQSDLTGYLAAVEADIQHLASQTRTPPHYLLGSSGAFPSGESLKATETGLVAKVNERRDAFTESWEDVMRLALKVDGDDRAGDKALEMVWKDPESRSIAEVVDAAVKLDAIGVPWRAIMAFVGYSPIEIERMDQERAEDAATNLLSSFAAPAPAAPPQPAPPPALPPAPTPGAPR